MGHWYFQPWSHWIVSKLRKIKEDLSSGVLEFFLAWFQWGSSPSFCLKCVNLVKVEQRVWEEVTGGRIKTLLLLLLLYVWRFQSVSSSSDSDSGENKPSAARASTPTVNTSTLWENHPLSHLLLHFSATRQISSSARGKRSSPCWGGRQRTTSIWPLRSIRQLWRGQQSHEAS